MRIATVLGIAFVGVASVHAQLVLDDFSTANVSYTVYSGISYYTQGPGTMVGGSRTEGLDILTDPFSSGLDVQIGGGYASLDQGSGLESNSFFGYGYTASADNSTYSTFDLGLNLSAYSQFTVAVASNESMLNAYIEVNDNPAKIANFHIISSNTLQTYNISFASMGFSGVDFSDIHQIRLEFVDPTNNDITLFDSFNASTPEPMSCAFLGLGVVGLIARRQLRK